MKATEQNEAEYYWTLEMGRVTMEDMLEYEKDYGYMPTICNGMEEHEDFLIK